MENTERPLLGPIDVPTDLSDTESDIDSLPGSCDPPEDIPWDFPPEKAKAIFDRMTLCTPCAYEVFHKQALEKVRPLFWSITPGSWRYFVINPRCDSRYLRKHNWYNSSLAMDSIRRMCSKVSNEYYITREVIAAKTHFNVVIKTIDDPWRFKKSNGNLIHQKTDWCIVHAGVVLSCDLERNLQYNLKEGAKRTLDLYKDYYVKMG